MGVTVCMRGVGRRFGMEGAALVEVLRGWIWRCQGGQWGQAFCRLYAGLVCQKRLSIIFSRCCGVAVSMDGGWPGTARVVGRLQTECQYA